MSSVAKKLLQAKTSSAGKTIAVCTGYCHLTVVDITDASNMSILGNVSHATGFCDVGTFAGGDADRDLVFSSGSSNTVSVGDYSDPSNPTVLQVFSDSTLTSPIRSAIPDTTRELLFVNCGTADKLACIDYSNPSSLSIVDIITSSANLDNAYGLAVDPTNEVVYSANLSDASVTSIDYSTPSSLSVLSELVCITQPRNLKLDSENDIVYVVGSAADGIASLDVSNPSSMVELDELRDSANLDGAWDVGLDLEDNIAIVWAYGSSGGLSSIDISNPASMSRSDTVTSTSFGTYGQLQLDTVRKIAFVKCDTNDSLTSVDYSDPSNLTVLGTLVDSTKLSGRSLVLK